MPCDSGSMKRIATLVLVSALASSCMGSFMLTRKLYNFNDTLTGSKALNHLVFWALVFVLPVYELALLGDAFILNVIEFWTGSSLLAADIERHPDGSIRLARGDQVFWVRPVSERRVEITVADRSAQTAVAERAAQTAVERLVGAVEIDDDGSYVISNETGPIASVPRAVLEAAAPALPHPGPG